MVFQTGSVGIILRVPLKREQVPGDERLPCIGV
jgi:hypothetical protein